MKRHTDIAIVYNAKTHGRMANVLRDAFEMYAVHASVFSVYQERDLQYHFCERLPRYRYTFLLTHGGETEGGEPCLVFNTVRPRNGDYDSPSSWEGVNLELTESAISGLQTKRQLLLSLGKGAGREREAVALFASET